MPHPAGRAFSNPLLALWRMAAIWVFSLFYLAPFIFLMLLKRTDAERFAHTVRWSKMWSRACSWISGVRVRVVGPPPPPCALLASNHISYGDIPAMLTATGCFFLPKDELGDWPIIGTFIRFSRQPLVKRSATSRKLMEATSEVEARLRAGQSVCVFLEGTTTNGAMLLPFMPSFLQPAIDTGAPVVPVAIRWMSSDPKVDPTEDLAYWRDETVFATHMWRMMGLRGIEAEVRCGEPIPSAGKNRKALAAEARREVLRLAELPDVPILPPEKAILETRVPAREPVASE